MSKEERASDKFDSWVRGNARMGGYKHYYPLLQIAREMRDEIESLQARNAELEALLYRVVNDLEYKCDIDGLRAFIIAALKESNDG